MKTLRVLPILFAVAASTVYATQNLPVKWFIGDSNVKTQKDFVALLSVNEYPDDVLTLYSDDGKSKKSVYTCIDYFKAVKEELSPQGTSETNAFNARVNTCKAFEAIGKALSSKISYLGNFKLDKQTVYALPPLGMARDSDDGKSATNLKQIKYYRDGKFKMTSPTAAEIDTNPENEREGQSFSIDAFGDFNDDGIEDVLIETSWNGGGTGYWSNLSLVSRLKKNGNFVLLRKY